MHISAIVISACNYKKQETIVASKQLSHKKVQLNHNEPLSSAETTTSTLNPFPHLTSNQTDQSERKAADEARPTKFIILVELIPYRTIHELKDVFFFHKKDTRAYVLLPLRTELPKCCNNTHLGKEIDRAEEGEPQMRVTSKRLLLDRSLVLDDPERQVHRDAFVPQIIATFVSGVRFEQVPEVTSHTHLLRIELNFRF